MIPRAPYKGETRKLVLAFDVGTTFSGISYCILDPGEVPVIRGVSRYPAQEQVGGDSKIPSIIYYDLQGVVRAVGAEALQERIIERAKDDGWVKLEWWKLHLCPKHLASSHTREDDIPPLPRGKSAVQVLADFMRYLFKCARTYIQESHLNLWRSVENSIEFVLTHPNDWEGPQQQQIRRAAELAGLISSNEEQSHVHLLTEGEASLRFCITNVITSRALSSHIATLDFPDEGEVQSGSRGVLIVDAGGRTIDLSAYSMKLSPTSFKEIAPAECCLQGSAFVTRRARDLLKNRLSGSNYSSPEMIAQMTNIFDTTTKLRFRKPDESSNVGFGTIRDNDLKYDIRSGQLKLTGQDIAGLFEPSVKAITEAFEQQKRVASTPVNFVFLVGGFAASDWLFARLQEYFQPLGINFCRPDGHVNKAVADGAISFYIDHLVSSRVARATHDVEIYTPFNSQDPEHQDRQHSQFIDPAVCVYPGQEKVVGSAQHAFALSPEQSQREAHTLAPQTSVTSILAREPYKGKTRKLVLTFDIGTTFSGVSYCILDPGEVPLTRGVSRYPAQEQVGGDSKIPSIIYYDLQGVVRAVGAEALQQRIIDRAKDDGWVKLEWWKLHLRPKHLASSHIREDDIPPLPRGKSAVQVLADFIRYLFKCARTYIQESHLDLWRSIENSIEFIFTHSNGWEGLQQQQIRRAAELAGLISSKEEQSHVHLLTEGEASLHFCITNVITSDAFSSPVAVSDFPVEEAQPGSQGVVIIDAGAGTIDLSAYSMQLSPPSFEEIAPAECCLQGSVFVTRRAHDLLKNKLSGSNYSSPEMIAQMTSIFDKTTKLRFRKPDESSYVKFGTTRDNDLNHDIRSGKLKLTGQDVAGLFEPSVKAIIEAFEQQRRVASTPVNFVFLVGGFAASDWLFARLQQYFQPLGISFCRPDGHANKAVADGAVSFYIDHLVSSRVARATYGIEIYTWFNSQDPEHQARQHTLFIDPADEPSIPNQFASILLKGTQVSELREFRRPFNFIQKLRHTDRSVDIMCYKGDLQDPKWLDLERSSFSTLCTIHPDLSELSRTLSPRKSALDRSDYYVIDFEVIMLFGLTELKALISWKYKGVEMRSPASIVYEE
ncbi:hypothetical protein K503DRAFT_803418 [Rhizopogon vinicolor AM-OR11-026]|uniref:Actin-like ATPase domain-containing protein n=1 Tax=Rhizopogon vinicolor AM-OR11-026 TaxID=1314800 RepID=A0A1B7MPV5_9AGAM|nr:hypothetical protein K503DRAFT_803418 [Rhizopogon vinicolor AM-OR11-026]